MDLWDCGRQMRSSKQTGLESELILRQMALRGVEAAVAGSHLLLLIERWHAAAGRVVYYASSRGV
jgi:hypothetical protein